MTPSVRIPDAFYEATLTLARLYRHPELQVRTVAWFGNRHVRNDIVVDYRQLYEDGRDLGPLAVVEEVDANDQPTGSMLLADGYHRCEALIQLGRTEALCRVYKGDRLTAILLGARENGGRGLSLTFPDRQKVVEQMLIGLARRGVTWSDVRIADWASMDRASVAKVREQLKDRRDVEIPEIREIMRADGTVYHMTPAVPEPPPERERYDPSRGYVYDPLLDNLPGQDEYIEPPAPRHARQSSSRSNRSGQYGGGKRAAQRTSAYPPQREDTEHTDEPRMPSVHFGKIERTPARSPASAGSGQPLRTFARSVTYDMTYRFDGDHGVVEGSASHLSIGLLPRDVRAQLLGDMGVIRAVEQLLRDLGVIQGNEPMSEELREKLLHYLRV